jgi:hypothetical protein
MRVLRQSAWAGYDRPPLTTVVRDSDVVDTLESVRTQLDQDDDVFVTSDIFDMPDGGVESATVAAMDRVNARAELNMAILYFCSAKTFPMLSTGGTILIPDPSPLTYEQAEFVLNRLAARQDYDNYRVQTDLSPSGETIQLVGGKVVRP